MENNDDEETQEELETRLDKEFEETLKQIQNDFPNCIEYNFLDETVQLLDKNDNVITEITIDKFETYFICE